MKRRILILVTLVSLLAIGCAPQEDNIYNGEQTKNSEESLNIRIGTYRSNTASFIGFENENIMYICPNYSVSSVPMYLYRVKDNVITGFGGYDDIAEVEIIDQNTLKYEEVVYYYDESSAFTCDEGNGFEVGAEEESSSDSIVGTDSGLLITGAGDYVSEKSSVWFIDGEKLHFYPINGVLNVYLCDYKIEGNKIVATGDTGELIFEIIDQKKIKMGDDVYCYIN